MQIIHPALWTLIKLQRRALWRRLMRGAKTPGGAVFTVLGMVMMFLYVVPSVYVAFARPREDGSRVHILLPLMMITFTLLSVFTSGGERAVAFMPAEADFLFPGPFTRRQLLVYKLVQGALSTILMSLMFSLLWMRHSQHWINGFIGYYLGMIFVQVFSMAAVLTMQSIGQQAATRGRRILLGLIVVAIALVLRPHAHALQEISVHDVPQLMHESTIAKAIFAPFDVFASIITAHSTVPEAIQFVGIAIGMIATLLVVVFWLDVQYMEAAAVAGQRVHARLQRMRRGGGLTSAGPSARASRFRLPVPPRLAGVGPIAWRQTLSAIRQSRGVFIMLACICIGGSVALGVLKTENDLAKFVIGGLAWITFTITDSLRFDFRGDVDRMDTLRALPISFIAIVIAELIAPVIVLFMCQLTLLLVGALRGKLPVDMLFPCVVAALPIDFLIIEIENYLFLLYPTRNTQATPGDMQGVGFKTLGLIIKLLTISALVGFAAGIAVLVYYFTRCSPTAAVVIAAMVVMLEAIGFVPLMAIAFRRFDPSIELPV